MSKITYDNKVDLNVDNTIANINKVTASDMNEIKTAVNNNDDNIALNASDIADNTADIGDLSTLTTTAKTDLVSAINELDGTIKNGDVYTSSEHAIGKWIDNKTIYRMVVTVTSINTNANTTDVPITISNLNEVVNISGSVRTNSGQYKPVASIYVDGNGVQSRFVFSVYTVYSTTLTVSYGDWWKNVFGKANIIIEYTKTTD